MTTRVRIENLNGDPAKDWSVEVDYGAPQTHVLKPGEQFTFTLWHDGRELVVREIPK